MFCASKRKGPVDLSDPERPERSEGPGRRSNPEGLSRRSGNSREGGRRLSSQGLLSGEAETGVALVMRKFLATADEPATIRPTMGSPGEATTMAKRVWGVHMGVLVGTTPIDKAIVGIGWSDLGDLAKIPADRDSFKEAVARAYDYAKPGSIPVQAGVLYRFVHEMKEGDVVVYPSKVDRMVNIGIVDGPYRHDPETCAPYPNIRPIKWLKHFPRENFSQAALYEIGSFITLFSVRNYADEFLAALEERPLQETEEQVEVRQDDETITKAVSAQAEETTHDFVIRQLKSGIDPYQFENFIAHLLECMGYHARVTTKSGDGGVDIIAHRDQLGFEPPIIKVQCKQVTGQIGRPEVTQLLGNVEQGEHGLFVTLGAYSRDAKELDRSKPNLRLINGEQLVDLIFENYRKFDPRYQAILPLKQIYVPSLKMMDL